MALDPAPLGPGISLVVMVRIAEQQARRASVDDQADVAARPDGPEVRVLGLAQLVKAHARVGGVELEVEGGRLHRLLLLVGQLGQAVGEGIGDAEVHGL